MTYIACTRMYDVTLGVRRHWHALMRTIADAAALPVECIDFAAPASLPALWARDDLALAFMCGFPLATSYPGARPLAAPVTVGSAEDRPSYRSVWIVRADSSFDGLTSTFGRRIGWTVAHSHSGFNAPRHVLLAHRTPTRPHLYRESIGPLGHPRAALAALDDDRIDVTAIDAYWWSLLVRDDPEAAARYRTIGETPEAPMPALVCGPALAPAAVARLVGTLEALHEVASAGAHLDALAIRRFVAVSRADYAPLTELDRAARGAGYTFPA